MRRIEGAFGYQPRIKKIGFTKRGKIDIYLDDGRIIVTPIDFFSDIKKLNSEQRKKWSIIGGEGFTFDDCDEVYHIEQILGKYDDYKYQFVSEPPRAIYKRKKKK
ncbi:MAG: DUF2442 domain-containing protein [Bacteroidetes bacterium]|nr:DUF2442 domain-containing protein [Bacteroidota bacterium]